jgi:hypothetical protein
MVGHGAGLATFWAMKGTAICALLYHPPPPCANPGDGIMMNKQRAIGVGTGLLV